MAKSNARGAYSGGAYKKKRVSFINIFFGSVHTLDQLRLFFAYLLSFFIGIMIILVRMFFFIISFCIPSASSQLRDSKNPYCYPAAEAFMNSAPLSNAECVVEKTTEEAPQVSDFL